MSSCDAELYIACMEAQQAIGTGDLARELGAHLDCKRTPMRPLESSGDRDWGN